MSANKSRWMSEKWSWAQYTLKVGRGAKEGIQLSFLPCAHSNDLPPVGPKSCGPAKGWSLDKGQSGDRYYGFCRANISLCIPVYSGYSGIGYSIFYSGIFRAGTYLVGIGGLMFQEQYFKGSITIGKMKLKAGYYSGGNTPGQRECPPMRATPR